MHPVEEARLKRGWSRYRLARAAAVKFDTIRAVEEGLSRPHVSTLAAVCGALDGAPSVVDVVRWYREQGRELA